MSRTIKEAFKKASRAKGFIADAAQSQVVEHLAELQQRVTQTSSPGNGQRRWFRRSTPESPTRGIYLWGGVGRGKTFLMDLFYTSLNISKKKRIHFHRMMSEVHARLKSIEDIEDPLDQVADDIASETRVLCFDEFFVHDIGDAMILGRLLDGLFRRGVVLVTTSNSPPRGLYKDGLQRSRFMPAIEALEAHTNVIELDGGEDYRLRLFEKAGTYLTPADDIACEKLQHYFDEIASSDIVEQKTLSVLGRDIPTFRCAKGIAWFGFLDICDGPRSQEDYIEIARWYPTVIVSDVPPLSGENDNPTRRFISLIDEFYDRRVKLLISAAAAPQDLYSGDRLSFEFQRTASRLIEMQTETYLHAEHLA